MTSKRIEKYEIFLSFRGEDTRNNFTDHLYAALVQRGIVTFKDDEELGRGKEVSSQLLKAIEESRFSIIILSKSYASSGWCLDELAKIVECVEVKGHTALPVFYYVDPSHVRNQRGDFKKAFDKHEKDFRENKEKVKRWRAALTKVSNFSGWHLKDRPEASLIKDIVEDIWRRLNQTVFTVPENLFGMDSHIEKMKKYLEEKSNDVGFIGLCGMGGIGKTTIARVVYDMFSYQYDGSSFIANVREVSKERGLVHIQEQLLSQFLNTKDLNIHDVHEGISLIRRLLCRRKIFLVLDDVDRLEQLEKLAGQRNWFGCGSRIIITTRNEHLLISHAVKHIYKVGGLRHHDALDLFLSKAFKHGQPTDDQVQLSRRVVDYTNGLPLALEVLGSLLCNRNVKEWESALDRLQEFPNKKILKRLRISYDGLEETEKKIFLDIACFFRGKDKDRVMEILSSSRFYPEFGIRVLIDKSLISISNNKLWMHDVLQEMGREIVRERNRNDPGKWSRLWLYNDIYHVLKENVGTEVVEGIILDKPKQEIAHLSGKSFSTMKNLRLLKISKVKFSEDLEYLSNELRFLKWHEYPLNRMPSSFQPQKLFKLDLCYSHIEYLWEGIKPFKELKTIKLRYSLKLIRTPDFTEVPNLEKLDLEGCTSLLEVHQSVGVLKRLTTLNLKDCKNLESFPSNICGLKSLKILNLHGCSKLSKLPENWEEVEYLEQLDLSGTALREVPSSIVLLKNLKILSFIGCYRRRRPKKRSSFIYSLFLRKKNPNLRLPALTGLSSLRKLDLSDCNLSEGAIPSDLGSLFSLEVLNLSGNDFVTLPASINQLPKLVYLYLRRCKRLQSLPELPSKIKLIFVGAEDCCSVETLSSALKLVVSRKMELLENEGWMELLENACERNSLPVMLLKRQLQLHLQVSLFSLSLVNE